MRLENQVALITGASHGLGLAIARALSGEGAAVALLARGGPNLDEAVAGRGIAPTALALSGDHALGTMGLHRVEVNIRPENTASLRVVEKLGFRPEGLRPRYLHIDGQWRDHLTFALTREEIGAGLLARWQALRDTPHANT